MTNEIINAYGYLRVSSEEQIRRWNWLNWQRWAIDDFADRNWIYIVNYYIDGWVSWKLASRKWLDEMINDLIKANKNKNKPEIKHVIVDDIDRIARDSLVWLTKRAEIENTWATIISLKQAVEDNPESRLSVNITMATKQYERENNSRRVISRQKQRLKDGYWCFCVPLWYKYEKAKQWWGKIVVPDEPTFSVVSKWLKLLSSGVIPNQQWLANYLDKNGIKARRWWNINKKYINHILHPDILYFYAGLLNCPKWDINMIKWKHQPAITESEFYQICNTYKIKWFYKDYKKDEISDNLPLRSILRCEYCWRHLSWSSTRWNWGRYFYYYCWSQKCPYYRKSFKCDTVHHSIENFLKWLSLEDDYLDWIKDTFEMVMEERNKDTSRQVSEINEEMVKIEANLTNLVNKIAIINSDVVIKKLEEEIETLETKKSLLKWELLKKMEVSDTPIFKFEQLRNVIKSPLSIRNIWDIALRKLLINVLFWGKMTYSIEHSIQTSEIPLVYADGCGMWNVDESRFHNGTQTTDTLGLLLYHWATLAYGGRGWTRTIDLTLIRGAL